MHFKHVSSDQFNASGLAMKTNVWNNSICMAIQFQSTHHDQGIHVKFIGGQLLAPFVTYVHCNNLL